MNRFVPLRYDSFKRLAFQLKKEFGLRHCETLDALSRASGFKDFREVAVICRSDQLNHRPAALQYAGDMGFDVWRAQVIAVVGVEAMAEVGPTLRCWYRSIFEVGGELAGLPAHRVEPGSVQARPDVPKAEVSLAKADYDFAAPLTQPGATSVVVTYRRRRRPDHSGGVAIGVAATQPSSEEVCAS